jgi:uncharacterized membrane protein
MNLAHLHLLLNHFPIIGTIIGLSLFLISLVGKNYDLRRAGLIVLALMALVALPTFFSGVGAQGALKNVPGVSEAVIDRHEGSAMLALLFMEITGALALVGLWQLRGAAARWNRSLSAVLFFSIITVGLMARVGTTGGEVRHPEIGSAVEGSLLAEFVHAAEPSPAKFTQLMLNNKFWWAFMMDMHFIGLALLVGTLGVLDLRMLGFAKKLPIGPLHQLIPWALIGFGINLVTGVLAFIGMPTFYTYDAAFWLKMSAIMLLGLNVAAFYLTDTFRIIERLGPGEDAPRLAKFIAGSSLFLCFAVIAFGRYIQWFSDNVDSISTH